MTKTCDKNVDSAMESLHGLTESIEEDATKKLFHGLCNDYGKQFLKERVLSPRYPLPLHPTEDFK